MFTVTKSDCQKPKNVKQLPPPQVSLVLTNCRVWPLIQLQMFVLQMFTRANTSIGFFFFNSSVSVTFPHCLDSHVSVHSYTHTFTNRGVLFHVVLAPPNR